MAYEKLLSTTAQRAFLGTVVTQGIIVLAMIAITFRFIDEQVDLTNGVYRTVPCYLALFILGVLFETWMVWDALRLRNVIQLVGIICFHLGLLVFGILQIHETHSALFSLTGSPTYPGGSTPHNLWHKVLPFLIVVPCVIGASWGILLLCLRQLYSEFGWAIFHVVGASVEFKKMYRYYQILICLLKLDFFCFTGVTMQLLIVVLQTKTVEFGLTIAAIPVVLILIAMCRLAVEREIKWLMSISLILMLASQAYFYKLVRFYEPVSEGEYVTTRATLTTFTIVSILLMFATFVFGLRCFADFDKGLQSSKLHDITAKPPYSPTVPLNTDGKNPEQSAYAGGGQLQQRISIE